jgi:uncharacterized membrane protein (Fun14 family)
MEVDTAQLGMEIGGGGVLGFVTGYATKKVIKIIAVLIGAQLVLFKILETRGVIEINWGSLYTGAGNMTAAASETSVSGNASSNGNGSLVDSLLSALPAGGGFVTGALLGFKYG